MVTTTVGCAGQEPEVGGRRQSMYRRPEVERFGSFRELTQWGGGTLFLLQNGLPGCEPSNNTPKKCRS